MTKKEFIKRMNGIKQLDLDKHMAYTCNFITWGLGKRAYLEYKQVIIHFLKRGGTGIDNKYNDISNLRGAVRILALTTFEIECLESGIYKEF